ncbi:pentatricopeptide repeat-containing protein At3g48250, chloroplastic-like [Lolium rigidum]|uniref:pentatricopeptide repeat-containing protein At3g48250, chloroplastic-like n=1 Tax=Lolium rigidum TaxID=89674 RepID=UPI001F5CF467|nr:pentatricopeptide repeat-containing protein At3g48250, chloroplastic-like [Lolium rigidum]
MAPPPASSHLRLLLLRRHRLFSTATATTPIPIPIPSTPPPAAAPTTESVLYSLRSLSKEDPSLALAFFRRSAESGHPLGSAAYNLMLRTLASRPASAAHHFWPFLADMEAAGHSVDQGTYLAALASFKKASLNADYASLADRLAKARTDAHPVSAAVLQEQEEEDGSLDKRLEGVELTETAVTKVLREVRDHPAKALAFFRWAGRQNCGYKHESAAYNAMARVLGREESMREFWDLIQEMKAHGMHLDIDTYVKLSRQFQKRHMMTQAVELYELMMDSPYKPSQADGPLLLRRIALGPSPDLELAYRVVRKYEAVYEFKSKDVFDGIHRALTSNGRFDEAAEVMYDMRAAGHQPDNITYSQLVFGLCKANKCDEARKVFDEMEAEGCVPDLKTWTMLIQGHCAAGEVDKALHYLTEMIENNLDADADLLDVMVKGLCNQDKVDAAHTLFVEMVDKGQLSPWQNTYKHIITELLRVKKLEDALGLLKSMKARKFPPFADPFPPKIAQYGTLEDARDFLKALKGSVNAYPAYTVYLLMFKSFFAEGRYSEAQDLLYKCPFHIRKHHEITKLFESIKAKTT